MILQSLSWNKKALQSERIDTIFKNYDKAIKEILISEVKDEKVSEQNKKILEYLLEISYEASLIQPLIEVIHKAHYIETFQMDLKDYKKFEDCVIDIEEIEK